MNTARIPAFRSYMIVLLMVILCFNMMDRIVLGMVLPDIKHDLDLSDTQLGFLSGLAFALFYSLLGIPIARWADRGNRVTIIWITTALWSIGVALFGFATSFIQLLLVRVAVAIGQAGCIPPATSLISDFFDRTERPKALAQYMLGAWLALGLGFLLGGLLSERYGWRATFVLLGIPGILLSVLAAATLREPRKRSAARAGVMAEMERQGQATTGLIASFGCLWRMRTFRHLLASYVAWFFVEYGLLTWQPTFFVRSHHLSIWQIGAGLAIAHCGGGLLGSYLSGRYIEPFFPGERSQLFVIAAMFAIVAVFNLSSILAKDAYMAYFLLAVAAIAGGVTTGPIYSAVQAIAPAHLRATALAILLLAGNLVGMGLGPLGVGFISDLMSPWASNEALRYALLGYSVGFVWAAWHFYKAGGSVNADIEAAETLSPAG